MPQLPDHLVPEEFAGNEWFVEEQYDKYRQDPSSVDPSWLPIFESIDKALAADSAAAPAPAAPAAPAPAPVASVAQTPAPAAAPAAVAAPKPEPVPAASAPKSKVEPVEEAVDKIVPLRGPAKAIAANMEESLDRKSVV